MATVLKNKGNKEKSIPVSSLLSQDGKIHHKRNADDNGDLSNMKVRMKKVIQICLHNQMHSVRSCKRLVLKAFP
jgi:hypothetical protein